MKNKELVQKVIHFLSLNSDLQHGPMDQYELQVEKLINAFENNSCRDVRRLTEKYGQGHGSGKRKKPFLFKEKERIGLCVSSDRWNIAIGCYCRIEGDWFLRDFFTVKDGFETWHDAEIYFNSMDKKRCTKRCIKIPGLNKLEICDDRYEIVLRKK